MKKHVKLYNRVFEALHYDDKFVLCLDKTHQEIVRIILEAMRDAVLSGRTNEAMAEAVLRALQDAGDEALSNDTLGQPESGAPTTMDAEKAAKRLSEIMAVGFDSWRKSVEQALVASGVVRSTQAEDRIDLPTARVFRKKPVVVEAFRLGIDSMPDWFRELVTGHRVHLVSYCNWRQDLAHADIETPEGVMRAERGDWIIEGVKGEVYPCKPDVFEMTYESVE